MKLLQRLIILTSLLIAATTHGASAVSLLNSGGTSLDVFGLRFSITGCQVAVNAASAATHACASGDNLQLVAVSTGRGTITVEIIGTGTPASAALTETTTGSNAQSNLIVGLSVALNPSYGTKTTKVTSAQLITNGIEKFTKCAGTGCSPDQAIASAALSGSGAPVSLLTANLALQDKNTAQTTQTVSSAVGNFTGAGSSAFTITETLNLTNTSDGLGGLRFNYAMLTLHTAPEPASIGIMLLGLGGLAAVRRRRRS
jgi:hypothetical protein